MEERKDQLVADGLEHKLERAIATGAGWLDRHWKLVVVAAWLLFCAYYLFNRWGPIHAFALGDTDDNLRMSQVRALLNGQDWFDLRQYRLNPPTGADVHWSRLVDLPIAGLILLLRPFMSGASAEMAAVAAAPLLPLLLLLFNVSLIVRRLVGPASYPWALLGLVYAGSAIGMFVPLRIDHHNWQLAFLSLAMTGLVDPKQVRGGIVAGIATALSLTIGLEMLIYLALAAAALTLFWVSDASERGRLAAYAASLSGGTALGFLLFASNADRLAVCDALSPVWLSDTLVGGALLFGIAWLSPGDWRRRLGLAALAGAAVAAFHALAWPHCLSRLEGISPEAERLWLSYVKEARPLYRHGWRSATSTLAIPVAGLIGWGFLAWSLRRDRMLLARTLSVAAPALTAILLLAWQTRTGPSAQVLALPGIAALVSFALPKIWRPGQARIQHIVMLVVAAAAILVPMGISFIPAKKPSAGERAIGRANRLCSFLPSFRPIAGLPKGTIFTFVDTGPRLITVTGHSAIAGPYHRNWRQIVDIMKAFRGSEAEAHAIVTKYRSNYLMICPNASTTTIFRANAPTGFYAQLEKDIVPSWLEPVPLPKDSPFRIWKVAR